MKTKITAALWSVLLSVASFAQINGSGKIISKNYDFRDFDKINFNDLNGKIDIEVGKTWSIQVDIDDNLENLLDVSKDEKEHLLKISFSGNRNNQLYIENTNIKIKITMPEASVIRQDGNADINIRNIKGRYFRIENVSNGNAIISGQVDKLDVVHTGNGNIDAKKLTSKTAIVNSAGKW
ncbi:GIN domain-containing protein [Flavobacterium pallidum]|nr:DUF2807 domain-containing protein [Flavobacterium pallidum]